MDIEPLLADLASKDAARVERAIGKLETALAKLDDSERAPIAARIAALAKHKSPDVRRAVASAAEHFPDPEFEAVIDILRADTHAFVQSALGVALDKRAKRQKQKVQRDDRDRKLVGFRERIEKKSSAEVRA